MYLKTNGLIKELILPSFWLLFFVAFSNSNNTPNAGKKVIGIKKQEQTSNSSEVIKSVANMNTQLYKAIIYLSDL